MKSILKTLPVENQVKYDETFTSDSNREILQKLIPELINAMRPRYNPSYGQIKDWLQSLHRHRRSRYNYSQSGKLDKDNRRLHSNSRLNEVNRYYIYIFYQFYLHLITLFYII
jgi:hypothetical protein